MKETGQNNNKVSDVLQKLLFDHYYSLSTESAYKGDYSLASNYISELIRTNGEIPILLDLLAKINVQQGDFKQAESLWEKCIRTEPLNKKYIEALSRLHKLQKSQIVQHLTLIKIIGAIAGIMLLLLMFVIVLYSSAENNSKLELLQKQQSEFLKEMDKSNITNEILLEDTFLSEIANKVEKIDGISILEKKKELVITFDDGLFSKGIKFKVIQKATIQQLIKILKTYSDNTLITILGCSDNIPITVNKQFSSNHDLDLARANFIYNIFYQSSRMLSTNLTIGSFGDNNTPFPNDSWENRMKNRTVVIKIIHKE